ncbi:Frizzled [Balamuthia mandrillaris]
MKVVATVILLVLLVIVSFGGENGAFIAMVEAGQEDMSEPQGPGARCVHIDDFTVAERGQCKDYLTYEMIYSDENTPYRLRSLQIWSTIQGLLPSTCLDSGWRSLCAGMFRECLHINDTSPPSANNTNEEGTKVAIVGRFPCKVLCYETQRQCQAAAAKLLEEMINSTAGLSAMDCTKAFPLMWGVPTYEIFPTGPNYTVPVTADDGQTYFNATIPCYDDNYNVTAGGDIKCPTGLHSTGTPGECAFDCPQPLITDNEYQAVEIMMSVMAWISLAATAFVAGSYLLVASKRKFPANLPLFFVVAVGGRTLAFCVGSMVGHEEVWCDGDKHFNSFGDAACTIQGILFVYFTWAGALWWLTITLNLFFTLVLSWQPSQHFLFTLPCLNTTSYEQQQQPQQKKHKDTKKGQVSLVEVMFHTCCWGVPFIPLIIALSGQQLGYAGASFWCTIHSGDGGVVFEGSAEGTTHSGSEEHNLWNLMLLTVPILVLVFIGVVLLIIAAVVGYKRSREGWQFLIRQWRLFAFLLLYVWIYTFVFSFQIHFNYVQEAQYEAYDDYINCLFISNVQDLVINPIEDDIHCELRQEVSYALWFVVTFNEVSQGLFVFLIFGTSGEIWSKWRLALWRCRWRAALASDGSTSLGGGGRGRPSSSNSSGQHKEVVVVEGVTMKEFTSEETTEEEDEYSSMEDEDENDESA